MKVAAAERGERPKVLTKSRKIAPQASIYLAKALEDKTFADSALIVIDWIGDFNWQGSGPMPEELRLPAMIIIVEKRVPGVGQMKIEIPLELEDMFGQDNASKDDLDWIVMSLEDHVVSEIQKRRST
jgi:hypothetical protein